MPLNILLLSIYVFYNIFELFKNLVLIYFWLIFIKFMYLFINTFYKRRLFKYLFFINQYNDLLFNNSLEKIKLVYACFLEKSILVKLFEFSKIVFVLTYIFIDYLSSKVEKKHTWGFCVCIITLALLGVVICLISRNKPFKTFFENLEMESYDKGPDKIITEGKIL